MGGGDIVGASGISSGVYGTKGAAAATNVPGGREYAASWRDSSGNFWLFGGSESIYLFVTGSPVLNDLWEYGPVPQEWTWVSRSDTTNALGTYGIQGTAAAANVPGARWAPTTWTDSSGNLWLFGGSGYDSTGQNGFLNDLWEFVPAYMTWTWISGSQDCCETSVYGTQGVASTTNIPAARFAATGWRDSNGNLWLFGGGSESFANDLWEYNPVANTWIWIMGNEPYSYGVYGTQGTPSSTNIPAARLGGFGWTDSSGNFWLFGGGIPGSVPPGLMSDFFDDLWEFNSAANEWTWMSGSEVSINSNFGNKRGVYGMLGVAATSNVPGSRVMPTGWLDSQGNLWLLGGQSFDSAADPAGAQRGMLNDLWRYQP